VKLPEVTLVPDGLHIRLEEEDLRLARRFLPFVRRQLATQLKVSIRLAMVLATKGPEVLNASAEEMLLMLGGEEFFKEMVKATPEEFDSTFRKEGHDDTNEGNVGPTGDS